MADYDHPSLAEPNRYLPEDVEGEFQKAKVSFLAATPAQRIAFLQTYDAAIAEDGRPTRGVSQLWRHQRELQGIHFSLLKVNR
jgi:hypothetical protein